MSYDNVCYIKSLLLEGAKLSVCRFINSTFTKGVRSKIGTGLSNVQRFYSKTSHVIWVILFPITNIGIVHTYIIIYIYVKLHRTDQETYLKSTSTFYTLGNFMYNVHIIYTEVVSPCVHCWHTVYTVVYV